MELALQRGILAVVVVCTSSASRSSNQVAVQAVEVATPAELLEKAAYFQRGTRDMYLDLSLCACASST